MNKLKMAIAISVSAVILTLGSVMIFQMVKNHQVNERIIDECFKKFDAEGKVIVTKDGFWAPVICEKNNL